MKLCIGEVQGMHARGLQLGGVATSKAQTWSSEGDMNPKNGGKPYKGAKLEGKVSKMILKIVVFLF